MPISSTILNGFWDGAYASLMADNRRIRQNVARMFRPLSSQKAAEILETLIGAAVGGTASRSITQVRHNEAPGAIAAAQGLTESRSLINRATVAADETAMEYMVSTGPKTRPATYAPDTSGNGGGGKLQ